MIRFVFAAAFVALSSTVAAAQRTVTLSVPSMDCPVCPITVKKALLGVEGVSAASVDFEQRKATVTFDDAGTRIEALTRATRDAGYPSTVVREAK